MAAAEKGLPVSEAVMQQSMLQQAQAAAAAQTDTATPTGQEALLQEADLFTTDAPEDDLPPPAYGDVYGEIRNEKDGLGSAFVTDDGRVNIRINQFNRRLSRSLLLLSSNTSRVSKIVNRPLRPTFPLLWAARRDFLHPRP
jgi:hypothetical protein